ncbi:glycosyltransferase family 2 protein [Thermus sp.]|uniref:glycosyltransferase family 2 protein n=1 Tax=Thermus sp. TaxID=275 RepID=UPI003D141365
MKWPKITVVTPSYNQARFLEATLRSVHDQGYPNLEHIVIDGGSTDGSVEIIRKFEDRLAYWVSEPDKGQTDALIKGFSRATGEILAWLNSDDLYEPRALWEVAEFFARHPDVQFVYGDALWIDTEGRILKPKKEIPFNRFIWFYDHNYIPQPSAFWRRELYEAVGGLDPRFDLAMDADLWIRFSERTRPVHVRRIWSRMRLYPEQKNQRLRAVSNQEDEIIRKRYLLDEPSWRRRVKRLLAKGMRVGWKLVWGCYR